MRDKNEVIANVERDLKLRLTEISADAALRAEADFYLFLNLSPRISLDAAGVATYSAPGDRPELQNLVQAATCSRGAWQALHELSLSDARRKPLSSEMLDSLSGKLQKPEKKQGVDPYLIRSRDSELCFAVKTLIAAGFQLTQSLGQKEERSACAIVGRIARECNVIYRKPTTADGVDQVDRDTANIYRIWRAQKKY